MIHIFPAPVESWSWLCERVGIFPTPQFKGIVAVKESGKIIGMVGYDQWTDNSVFMHVALDEPIAVRPLLKHAFTYPFQQCGRRVALATVVSDNEKSKRFVNHLGFSEIARVKDGHSDGKDLVLYAMRREGCKWVEER